MPNNAASTTGSRILSILLAFAQTIAAQEAEALLPHVTKAFSEVPADIKASNPVAAFLATATNAWVAILADPNVVPSFSGLLAATAKVTTGS